MKVFLLLLIFSWSCSTESIETQSIKSHGYWPLPVNQTMVAIMPVNNHQIITEDVETENQKLDFDPKTELIHASFAAFISLGPHYILGYYLS